jgi:ABC-2 type transport system ATP-binding protein
MSHPATPAITVTSVTKRFQTASRRRLWKRRDAEYKIALDEVSLSVERGEMLAIVGLNGSGKSTLIRILATLTIPDTGSAEIFGHDVVRHAHVVRRHVNRVSVDAAFFKEMSAWENLSYATHLYGGGNGDTRQAAIAALAKLGLPRTVVDRPMKQLSRGQQQKVAIARSLLTSPSLLLMDEPTTGLDPRSKREVEALVTDIHSESGATVVVCTHDLAEAEALCQRVIVMDRGQILADASPAALRQAHQGVSLEDVFLRLTGRSFDDDSETDTPSTDTT